eukprot:TRINITY_DN15864_c0_g1_i1.p1 TRINITY_DN15864_c0_g1~~TRINITY_DN15864_c0_g1_i1.p1  ORF type:complete len:684 (+),score=85.50 TRINITY_DN15864_c0_g1_i1:46-2052(+)
MFSWLGGGSVTWPDGNAKPSEGEWKLLGICQSGPDQGKGNKEIITIKKESNGDLTLSFREQSATIIHASEVKGAALPELMDPVCWVGFKTSVMWLQPVSDNQHLILIQKRDECNGSSFGERFFMSLTGTFVPLTSGISLKNSKWNMCALARSTIDPWWKTEMKRVMKKTPPSYYPSFLSNMNIQHTESAWIHKAGWISTSSIHCWLTLTDGVLFMGGSASANDIDEMPLIDVTVKASDPIQSTQSLTHHTLTIKTNGTSSLIGFLTPVIRDKWIALLSLSAGQYGSPLTEANFLQHLSRVTLTYCPEVSPPVNPNGNSEQIQAILSGNVVTKQGTSWVGDWKRRYTTVHKSCILHCSEKGGQVTSIPLGGSLVIAGGGGTDKASHNQFLFTIASPHLEAPFSFWCDSEELYRKWIWQISASSAAATAAAPLPVQEVTPDTFNPESLGSQINSADALIKLTKSGLAYSGVGELPGVQGNGWRKLTSTSSLFGIEKEAVKKNSSGKLTWTSGADHGFRPLHEVETEVGFVPNLDGSPNIVRDIMLLKTEDIQKLLHGSCIAASCNIRVVCVAMLPHKAEYTLRSVQASNWFAVYEGSIVIRVFPPSAFHVSTFVEGIPLSWDKSTSPLGYIGGRQVTLHAGEALFVPAQFFYSVMARQKAVIARLRVGGR